MEILAKEDVSSTGVLATSRGEPTETITTYNRDALAFIVPTLRQQQDLLLPQMQENKETMQIDCANCMPQHCYCYCNCSCACVKSASSAGNVDIWSTPNQAHPGAFGLN